MCRHRYSQAKMRKQRYSKSCVVVVGSSVLKAHGSALDSAVDNVSEDAEGEAHKEGQLDIQKELEEWDRVSAFREKLAEEEEERLKVSKAGIKPKDAQTPIGWKEALAFFKAQDVSVQKVR